MELVLRAECVIKENTARIDISVPQVKEDEVRPRTGHEGPTGSRGMDLLFLYPRCWLGVDG